MVLLLLVMRLLGQLRSVHRCHGFGSRRSGQCRRRIVVIGEMAHAVRGYPLGLFRAVLLVGSCRRVIRCGAGSLIATGPAASGGSTFVPVDVFIFCRCKVDHFDVIPAVEERF